MPVPLAVTRFNKALTNKALIHLAGHGTFVELEHVGRKSGTVRRIPIRALLSPDGSCVSCVLTYGPKVDWYRNVQAAGGCRMRTKDGVLTLGPPRRLSAQEGLSRVPAPARVFLRLARVTDFLEMPVLNRAPSSTW